MLISQAFLKRGKKFIQEKGEEEGKQVAGIRSLFLDFLGRDYHEMSARDLFDWEIAKVSQEGGSLYQLLNRLGNILDFLKVNQDDVDFEREEGALLVALVEESAGDLPLKELTQIMKIFISKRLI